MRELSAGAVTEAVARLCIRANTHLTEDVTQAIAAAREAEDWPAAREILDRILENDAIGGGTPICQDTGMACVFLEVGQDVHITGDLRAAPCSTWSWCPATGSKSPWPPRASAART